MCLIGFLLIQTISLSHYNMNQHVNNYIKALAAQAQGDHGLFSFTIIPDHSGFISFL